MSINSIIFLIFVILYNRLGNTSAEPNAKCWSREAYWCHDVPAIGTKQLFWKTSWWRHQMETFSALLAICAGNSPVLGEFPAQRPVTRSFDVFFDLRPNKRLSKQSWGWWFETLSRPLWRHRNDLQLLWKTYGRSGWLITCTEDL